MPRDMEICRYIERYDYCTTRQIEKSFFRDQNYSYVLARRRLDQLVKHGYIKVEKDDQNNRNIYVFKKDKMKSPTPHRLIILDVLAEMHYSGFQVEHFEVEKHWIDEKNKGVYSDGFAIFTFDDGKEVRRYHYFIEVQTSNNAHNLEKYDKLHDMNLVQKFYLDNGYDKNFFPKRILLISDREYKTDISTQHCQVIQLDTKLNNFYKILM
jgi:hypothetical protein